MVQDQFKRNIAYKLRVGDILVGKPIIDNERFSFLELGDKKIVRANVAGNIVDKYESEKDTKFLSLTLDDGSGQIKLKIFGDDVDKYKDVNQGQTVVVVGVLRFFNNEIYLSPEIIKENDPRYLLVRKLEIEKDKSLNMPLVQKEQVFAIKDKLLELIKNAEQEGGIDLDKIIMNPLMSGTSPDIINQEIQKLLEEGIIFEPRPGRVRWLG